MISNGIFKIKRIAVSDAASSFASPTDVTYILMQNVGSNDIKFNETGSFTTDYFTIKVGAQIGPFPLLPGSVIHTDGVGGASTLEVLFWG